MKSYDPEAPAPEPFRHPDHKRPVTRREFLGQGFLSGLGMVMLPSLSSLLLPREARAQFAPCNLATAGGMIPFLCIDLAGGANMAGSNVMVGGAGGQLDFLSESGYAKLGLPSTMLPSMVGQLNQDLGIAFHSDSAFLRGILTKASPTTLAGVNGSFICSRSDNDTGNNPHNPMYGIARAGASGDLVGLIGTENSMSGGNSLSPMTMIDPTLRPTKVDRPSDARGLVDTGKLVTLFSQSEAAAVMQTIQDISDAKLVHASAEDQGIKDLIHCGYVKTTDQVNRFGNPDQLDPTLDPEILTGPTPIFTQAELDGERKFRKTASVMKLVLNGLAGAGTLEFGGYDYHDGTRATGEVRDFEAGVCMGAILEYAARLGTPVMLYAFSDGSLSSDGRIDTSVEGRDKGLWRGDNSSTGGAFMLVYNPAGTRPALRGADRHQIGYFKSSGDVETDSSLVADDVNRLAQSVVLNYLALHGLEGQLGAVLPGHGLGDAASQDALIAFDQLV